MLKSSQLYDMENKLKLISDLETANMTLTMQLKLYTQKTLKLRKKYQVSSEEDSYQDDSYEQDGPEEKNAKKLRFKE